MLHWQQFAALTYKPVLGLLLLAIGAMPIAAGASYPVFPLTTLAPINQVAQVAGSTAGNQAQDLAMMRRHPGLIPGDVIRCKLSQCIGDRNIRRGTQCIGDRNIRRGTQCIGDGGRLNDWQHLVVGSLLAPSKQAVDDDPRVGLRDLGQVKINQGRLETAVTQVFLDRLETHTGFEQVRGVGMPQRVAGNFFAKVQLLRDLLEGRLNRADAHRCLGRRTILMISAFGGEQEARILVRLPEPSQGSQG